MYESAQAGDAGKKTLQIKEEKAQNMLVPKYHIPMYMLMMPTNEHARLETPNAGSCQLAKRPRYDTLREAGNKTPIHDR
jgi:hypothetical protein